MPAKLVPRLKSKNKQTNKHPQYSPKYSPLILTMLASLPIKKYLGVIEYWMEGEGSVTK